ncbi:MAG: ribonuclease HII [Actinobacteria bacterium]|nr:MAG: ribonuclease HII [Actinomycetota bacterium]
MTLHRLSSVTQDVERGLASRYGLVAGIDEVGRGALAGPVSVGVAVIDETVGESPAGLADSKLLSPRRREALCDPIRQWVRASAVGHASASEIDAYGIVGALRLAGHRALHTVAGAGFSPDIILLDGSHNWLASQDTDLFSSLDDSMGDNFFDVPPVVTQVKADMTCAVVSAASVIAKVERDRIMAEREDPGYEWARNKGYASAAHRDALRRLGVSDFHRRSWKLPGVSPR